MAINLLWADIRDQPRVLYEHAPKIAETVRVAHELSKQGEPLLTGIATSYYAWQSARIALQRNRFTSFSLTDTAELLDYGYPVKDDKRPLFILSRSGESAEIVRLIETIHPDRLVAGITEMPGSTLARRSDYVLDFKAGEQAFSNTKSFTLSLAYTLACAIGFGVKSISNTNEWILETVDIMEKSLQINRSQLREVAELIGKSSSLLLVGRGYLTGVVNQIALDLQEIVRMPTIPIDGGIFRHGTIELTARTDVTTLFLLPNDCVSPRIIQLIEELHEQSASIAVVVSKSVRLNTNVPMIRVPDTKPELLPFVYSIVLHQLAAEVAQVTNNTHVQPSLVGKVTLKE